MSARPALPFAVLLLVAGCPDEKPAAPLSSLKPRPLPALEPPDAGDRDGLYRVEAAPVYGEKVPQNAKRLKLAGTMAQLGNESFDLDRPEDRNRLQAQLGRPPEVLLEPDADTYLAQAAAALALLDDAGAKTWLLHPTGSVAFAVRLRDEAAFQAWLDEVTPGRVRVIQRADGFELQTAVGKLAGPDPNGPSVPVRGGRFDIATLRRGLDKLAERFDMVNDVCFIASYGMELRRIAEAMSADYSAMGEPFFEEICFVYPRPSR